MLSCFRNAPAWRPVTAFIAGIISYDAGNISLLYAAGVVACVLSILALRKGSSPAAVSVRGAALLSLFFLAGAAACHLRTRSVPAAPEQYASYTCTITGQPEKKGRTLHTRAELKYAGKQIPVMLYLADDSLHRTLTPGSSIACTTGFSMPPRWHGYRRYLEKNHIYGTAYIASGKSSLLYRQPYSSPSLAADRFRSKADSILKAHIHHPDAAAVVSALVLGNRNSISDELKEDFSLTGASHVLALSGLHLGIVMMIISVLATPLRRTRAGRVASNVALIVILFAYAFFTGMSPSVTRAAVMLSAIKITEMMGRNSASMNTLFLTAFVMLVIEPYNISDIGFQLSFTAVFFILAMYPWWREKVRTRNRALRYFADLAAISVIAQLGTAPLVAMHFGNFPLLALPVSVLILPVLPFIISMALATIVLSPFPAAAELAAMPAEWLTRWMNGVVGTASSYPGSYFSGLDTGPADVVMFYLIVLALSLWVAGRKSRHLVYAASVALVWAATTFATEAMESRRHGVTFTGDLRTSACTVRDSGGETHITGGGLYRAAGMTILRLDGSTNGTYTAGNEIDIVWICRGSRTSLKRIASSNSIARVVLDNSLTPRQRKALTETASALGIEVADMYEHSTFFVTEK